MKIEANLYLFSYKVKYMKSNLLQNNPKNKNIQVGKIYFIHDSSKSGHPGLVIWKDDEHNRYLVIRFDSDKEGEIPKISRGVRHITKLSHTIGSNVKTSYARNRPLLCKRKDIGFLFKDLCVHKDDQHIINKIAKNKSEKSRSFK